MDDIFDNLIYIIITIVAFAISALGKKKKKDARRNATVPTSKESYEEPKEKPFLSNLEKLLNDEIGLTNQNIRQEKEFEPIIEEETIFKEKKEVLDSVPPEMLDDKEDIPYSVEYEDTKDVFSSSISDKDITKEEEEVVLEDFNLRDAIIYSEIINRKEY